MAWVWRAEVASVRVTGLPASCALPPREVQSCLLLVPAGLGRAAWDPSQADLETATAFSQASLFLWSKDAKWQLRLLPDPSGSHGSAQASLTENRGGI